MSNLNELIKKIALSALEEKKSVEIFFGVVESESPLQIRLDQKKVFGETFLELSNNVKNFNVDITTNGVTQQCTIHNELKKNEKVILIRFQGGQKYLVLDRM